MKTLMDNKVRIQAKPALAQGYTNSELVFLMNHMSCVEENLSLIKAFRTLTKN